MSTTETIGVLRAGERAGVEVAPADEPVDRRDTMFVLLSVILSSSIRACVCDDLRLGDATCASAEL